MCRRSACVAIAGLSALACSTTAAAALKPEKERLARRDQELLQGTWYTVTIQYGSALSGEDRTDAITYEGNRYVQRQNGVAYQSGTYRIVDAAADPKQIEYVCTEGATKGLHFRSIYSVSADDHWVCSDNGNDRRPAEFSGKAGFLRVTRRVKE